MQPKNILRWDTAKSPPQNEGETSPAQLTIPKWVFCGETSTYLWVFILLFKLKNLLSQCCRKHLLEIWPKRPLKEHDGFRKVFICKAINILPKRRSWASVSLGGKGDVWQFGCCTSWNCTWQKELLQDRCFFLLTCLLAQCQPTSVNSWQETYDFTTLMKLHYTEYNSDGCPSEWPRSPGWSKISLFRGSPLNLASYKKAWCFSLHSYSAFRKCLFCINALLVFISAGNFSSSSRRRHSSSNIAHKYAWMQKFLVALNVQLNNPGQAFQIPRVVFAEFILQFPLPSPHCCSCCGVWILSETHSKRQDIFLNLCRIPLQNLPWVPHLELNGGLKID